MSSNPHPLATPGSFILNGVTVVDTRRGGLMPNMAIVIDEGRIREIVPSAAITPDPATVVDAPGRFVVPGFLDMHAHILDDPRPEDGMNLMLAHGVTGWRQMTGTPELLAKRKQGDLALTPDGPELLEMPGQILTPANAPSPEASIAEVQRQKTQGADFIKTIAVSPKTFFASLQEATSQGLGYAGHLSIGVRPEKASEAGMLAIEHLGPLDMQLISCSTRGWIVRLVLALRPPKMPDLSPEKIATIGKLVIASPTLFRLQMDPKGLSRSQQLVDTFSESNCRNLGKICAQHGTWQIPTLIRIDTMQLPDEPRFTDDPNLRYISKSTRQFWDSVAQKFTGMVNPAGRATLKQMMELALKMTKIFDECGVKMLAGSDYGGMWVIPGYSMHQEFDLLERAGLSPLRVLQMTTLDGATFLHREATMGTVEAGKDANLVLLDGDPTQSVQNLHKIYAVVRAGRYYTKKALEGLKQNVADRVAFDPDPAPLP